jgi:uncharacterized membrane protein
MDELYVIVLRLAHIGAGVLWVGAAYTFFGFVKPTLKALGPETNKNFMQYISKRRRFPIVISTASVVTVVAGVLLYWRTSDGLDMAWIGAPIGLGFTIGAVAGIIALLIGMAVITPTIKRLEILGGEVAAGGGPPSTAQAAELQALDARLGRSGVWDFALLTIALVTMAISRYLPAAW